jgi:hypothetical protein
VQKAIEAVEALSMIKVPMNFCIQAVIVSSDYTNIQLLTLFNSQAHINVSCLFRNEFQP